METTTLSQDTLAKPHQQYLQALKKWDKNRQLTTESNNTQKTKKTNLSLKFKNYRKLTCIITAQHATWQIDTIEKLLNRNETFENICKMVRIQKPTICPACDKKNTLDGIVHKQKNKRNYDGIN